MSFGKLFGMSVGKQPALPDIATLLAQLPTPASADPELARRRAAAKRASEAIAAQPRATILTGPQGVTTAAPVQRSTLLGA